MIRQEVTVRQIFSRHREFFSYNNTKMLVEIFFRLVFTKSRGEYNAVVVGRDGDDPLIKGFVVQGRQADAIAGI